MYDYECDTCDNRADYIATKRTQSGRISCVYICNACFDKQVEQFGKNVSSVTIHLESLVLE